MTFVLFQPLDLNLDEETLMRIVPFWRTSLSDPNTPSQLYYFDHFAIHPIKVSHFSFYFGLSILILMPLSHVCFCMLLKIVASFSARESYASYSSTQETLRSLLHSVIKV